MILGATSTSICCSRLRDKYPNRCCTPNGSGEDEVYESSHARKISERRASRSPKYTVRDRHAHVQGTHMISVQERTHTVFQKSKRHTRNLFLLAGRKIDNHHRAERYPGWKGHEVRNHSHALHMHEWSRRIRSCVLHGACMD